MSGVRNRNSQHDSEDQEKRGGDGDLDAFEFFRLRRGESADEILFEVIASDKRKRGDDARADYDYEKSPRGHAGLAGDDARGDVEHRRDIDQNQIHPIKEAVMSEQPAAEPARGRHASGISGDDFGARRRRVIEFLFFERQFSAAGGSETRPYEQSQS